MITAHGSAELCEEAIRAGALLTLTKPFDMHVIVERIREAMAA